MDDDWKKSGQKFVYKWIDPFIHWCIRVGITPNLVTFIGMMINILAAVIFIFGAEKLARNDHSIVGIASAVILFAGLFDMIDGRLARVGQMDSKYGALYDSVLDRYSEMIMFLGICYYLVKQGYFLSSLFAFIAMIGSIMVSYTRARAEGLGVKMADVGFMQRPERILLVGVSGIICGLMSSIIGSEFKIRVDWCPFPLIENITFFTFPIFILAILSNITAVKRLIHAEKMLKHR
ncbi:MAG: CDP-alcohol phosphatidyltransferase family protein [Saprospiraceae bacterium]